MSMDEIKRKIRRKKQNFLKEKLWGCGSSSLKQKQLFDELMLWVEVEELLGASIFNNWWLIIVFSRINI